MIGTNGKRAARIAAALIASIFAAVTLMSLPACFGKPETPSAPSGTEEAVLLFSPSPEPTAEPTAEPTPAPTEEPEESRKIREALSRMTLEEKVGQLMLFGFSGVEAPAGSSAEFFRRYPIGNVIMLASNIDKTGDGGFTSAARMTAYFEENLPCAVPRLFAADVEGGSVVRFDWPSRIPSAAKLGKKAPDEVRELFRGIGEKLRSCGINLDLAPVADIAEEPAKSVMGSRIVSSDLDTVITICGAVIDGLHEGGCLSCAKHFPGHGSADADSHSGTPAVYRSRGELMEYDAAAFAGAIEAGADCVMTAHVLYPALDGENIATLSPDIITGLLREELGFDGVVISDDMLMQGLSISCRPAEAAVRFILAGGDMLLCGADAETQESIFCSVLEAVQDGRITEERLDESVSRILRLKLNIGL